MKIVIDTNVVASAIFFGGKPRQLLELLVTHKLEAFVSSEITTEYQETVAELCSKYPSKPIQLPLSTIIGSPNYSGVRPLYAGVSPLFLAVLLIPLGTPLLRQD